MITDTQQYVAYCILPRAFGVVIISYAFSSQTLSFEGYLYRYTELENILIQENESQFI